MKLIQVVISLIILFLNFSLFCQETLNMKFDGVEVNAGIGHQVIKDENISIEKYSGTINNYSLSWQKHREKYNWRFFLNYRSTEELKSYKITARLREMNFGWDYSYPIKKFTLFSKDAIWSLGPSPFLYFHYRRQNIADSYFANSLAGFISIGINSVIKYELFPKVIIRSSFRSAIFSIIGRSINPNLYSEGKVPIKLVTPFSVQSSYFETQLMYNLYKRINIGLLYEFNMVRITPWEYFISANDNIYISILINL